MKKLILLGFLIIISCNSKESTTYEEMKSDKLMSEHFLDSELKDLAKIVDFFESEIHHDNVKTKEEVYHSFNKNTIEEFVKEIKGFQIPLSFIEQKKMYRKIDSSFFKEIWVHPSFYLGKDYKNKITQKHYDLNQFGKYAMFLKSLENEDKLFKYFYKMLSVSNETSIAILSSAFSRLKMKEFKGVKRRLFFAIYYLTVNDKLNNYTSRKTLKQ